MTRSVTESSEAKRRDSMKVKRIVLMGVPAGLTMGISLFIVGAVAARLVYGPQFVPEGKFEPEQINAWYFL